MDARTSRTTLFALLFLILVGLTEKSNAEVGISVGVNIPPPPAYAVPAPPPVVLIPGTYVYYAPNLGVDILFYQGYWYRPHGGYWFRARSYNGPWAFVAQPRVPRALAILPPDYRRVPPGFRPIPYWQLRRHWGWWERDRYWDRHRQWRGYGYGPHRGRGNDDRRWGREEGHDHDRRGGR